MAKILVVEDDAMIRDLVSRRLSWEGFQVVTAVDGAQGVVAARSELPALILMDMGLPILNGWQATHRIKATPETQSIPIIALTARALAEDRIRCIRVGCDDYEPKPVDFHRLLGKIHSLVDKR